MAHADGTIIINTKINTDGIKEGIDEAKKELSLGDVIKGSAIGSVVADLVQSVVSNVKEIGQAFIESAATVKAESSQFVQTFGDMQSAAHNAIGGIAEDSGILETRLNTLGSRIYAFARSSGGDTAESLDLMEKALQAAADGAAYYDRSLEETTESLQSFLKGNYENDAALGLSATETTRNAKAMEMFGEKFQNLTEIQKQQALLQMVLDAQELSGAMGQAAREADGWENVQGNLNESIRQFQAAAGQPFLNQLVPIVQGLTSNITKLTTGTDWGAIETGINTLVNSFKEEGLKGFIDSALPMITGFTETLRENAGKLVDSGLEMIVSLAKGFADGLPTLIEEVPKIVSNIAGIINDNAPKFITTAVKIIGTLAKGLIQAIPTLVKNIPSIITAIVDVFTAYNWMALGKNLMTFMRNGIKNMISSLKTTATSVRTNIVNAVKSLPTQLKTFATNGIKNMISGIKGLFASLKTTSGSILTNVVNAVKSMPTKLKSYANTAVKNIISAIKNQLSSVKSTAGKIVTNMVNGIKKLPSKLVTYVKNAISQMKSKFTSGGWKDLGKDIINGIVAGISSSAGKILDSLLGAAKSALNSVKDFLGIHSPSRKFRDVIGKMIPLGITEGIDTEFPDTIKALKKQANNLINTAGNLVPGIMEYSMPVMATGTILPAGIPTESYYGYLGALGEELRGLKDLLLSQRPERNTTNSTIHVTAECQRKTLFDLVVDEGRLRMMQSGKNPFKF